MSSTSTSYSGSNHGGYGGGGGHGNRGRNTRKHGGSSRNYSKKNNRPSERERERERERKNSPGSRERSRSRERDINSRSSYRSNEYREHGSSIHRNRHGGSSGRRKMSKQEKQEAAQKRYREEHAKWLAGVEERVAKDAMNAAAAAAAAKIPPKPKIKTLVDEVSPIIPGDTYESYFERNMNPDTFANIKSRLEEYGALHDEAQQPSPNETVGSYMARVITELKAKNKPDVEITHVVRPARLPSVPSNNGSGSKLVATSGGVYNHWSISDSK